MVNLEITLCIDPRILSEYRDVLWRRKFGFDQDHLGVLIDYLERYGRFVSGVPLQDRLPDPDDEPFLEAAITGNASAIVTGNKVHYPQSFCLGVPIFSFFEFIAFYRSQPAGRR